jgi:hypothetical protein
MQDFVQVIILRVRRDPSICNELFKFLGECVFDLLVLDP